MNISTLAPEASGLGYKGRVELIPIEPIEARAGFCGGWTRPCRAIPAVNVVDSSAWLEYFADGPNAGEFAEAIADTERLLVPGITLFEVFKRVRLSACGSPVRGGSDDARPRRRPGCGAGGRRGGSERRDGTRHGGRDRTGCERRRLVGVVGVLRRRVPNAGEFAEAIADTERLLVPGITLFELVAGRTKSSVSTSSGILRQPCTRWLR